MKNLNSENVDYLVVGGYAVIYYGHVRATGDLDVWVAPRAENAEKLARALVQFGFSPETVPAERFTRDGQVFRIGLPPVRIDLLTRVSGLVFEEAYSRRQTVELDGVRVNILDLADLKANKKASGRPKDLGDLDNLP